MSRCIFMWMCSYNKLISLSLQLVMSETSGYALELVPVDQPGMHFVASTRVLCLGVVTALLPVHHHYLEVWSA